MACFGDFLVVLVFFPMVLVVHDLDKPSFDG